MPMQRKWDDNAWKTFARRVWELKQTPEHKHRVYWGPIYMVAQEIFPEDMRHSKSYFSALGKEVRARLDGYFAEFNGQASIESRAATPPVDVPKEGDVVDYEKLVQMLLPRLRPEVEEAIEVYVKAELDERLQNINSSKGLPHWARKNGSRVGNDAHKIRVALFGIEERNVNTNRFNYLKHCLDIRIFEGGDPVKAKHLADTSEFCIIASNSHELTRPVVAEVKKSATKNIFTSGGLSAIDSALQVFCQGKGLKYVVPEHPSHQIG